MNPLPGKVGIKIGLIQRRPDQQSPERKVDQRSRDIKRFDEWLLYVKETDPQAFQELINLGKGPMIRGRVEG